VVRDSFDGQGSVALSWGWVFGRDFQDFDREHLLAFGERAQVKLRIDGLAGLPQAVPIFGAVPGGWISREYGEKKPGLAVRLYAKVALPATVETCFDLRPA
jgi:hypothetical protein